MALGSGSYTLKDVIVKSKGSRGYCFIARTKEWVVIKQSIGAQNSAKGVAMANAKQL
jgi:hypothetical protein